MKYTTTAYVLMHRDGRFRTSRSGWTTELAKAKLYRTRGQAVAAANYATATRRVAGPRGKGQKAIDSGELSIHTLTSTLELDQ